MIIFKAVTTLVVTLLAFASAQSISDCATGCVSGVLANAAALGCANGNTQCVCAQADKFHDGIRDCITGACPNDVSQTPLAITYGDSQCALLSPADTPAPTPPASSTTTPVSVASTTSSVPDSSSDVSSSTPVATSTVSTSTVSMSTISSSVESLQTTITDTPGAITGSPSPTSLSSPASDASTSASPSPTTDMSQTPSTDKQTSNTGLSTAVKAGIGAGAGVAALAAIIIAFCVCLRRRQAKKVTNPARSLKISEPMAGPGRQYTYNVRDAESGLSQSVSSTKATHVGATIQPTSPTSTYSYSSELESNARRYEDLLPRTQPRTMI